MKQLLKLDFRIPNWDKGSLIDRVCPICNMRGEPLFQRPDQLFVNRCENCSTYYVSPAPDNDCLNDFYSTYHDNHSLMPKLTPVQLEQAYDKINPLADIRIRKLSSYFNIIDFKVLDIGFGQPFLLYQLKKLGAETHGIDIDPTAIEYAKYLNIHAVYEGEIFNFKTQIEYDAVIMTDFVEHPLDPLKYIISAVSLLKKGGLLLIWTPNGIGEITNEQPITFRVDLEHMQYFTSQTIFYIANELNLEIIHLETLGQGNVDIYKETIARRRRISTDIKIKIKRLLKKAIKKWILKQKFETNIFPVEIGNYHLFAILKRK